MSTKDAEDKKREREREQLKWRLLERLEDAIEVGDKRREKRARQDLLDAGFTDIVL